MPRRLAAPIAVALLVLVLAAIAGWTLVESGNVSDDASRLRAESAQLVAKAHALSDGAEVDNAALTDQAKTDQVVGAVRPIVEKTLSYDYRDLDATTKAVADNVAGKALCEYDKIFGQVRAVAGEQQLTLVTKVREIGVNRLQGDQADLLVFVDQTTTRGDSGQSTASGAQFGINAERQDGKWKITAFDVLGQPLPNGQPVPQC